ncbi:hypothetical protein CBL_13643 [Carabus blaptoides fortunei]
MAAGWLDCWIETNMKRVYHMVVCSNKDGHVRTDERIVPLTDIDKRLKPQLRRDVKRRDTAHMPHDEHTQQSIAERGVPVMERVDTGDVSLCKKEPTVRAVLLLRGNGNRGGCRDPLVQTEEKIRLEHQAENHLGHDSEYLNVYFWDSGEVADTETEEEFVLHWGRRAKIYIKDACVRVENAFIFKQEEDGHILRFACDDSK